MRENFPHVGRLLTTFGLLIAIAATGFAHSFKTSEISPELAAYVAIGGSIADICDGTTNGNERVATHCDACLLIGSAILVDAAYGLPITIPCQTLRVTFSQPSLRVARALDAVRLTRAPPQA